MNFTSDELNMIYDAIETKKQVDENNLAFVKDEEERNIAEEEINEYEKLLSKITKQWLPNSVVISDSDFEQYSNLQDEVFDWISYYLSDKYGFCHKGFNYEIEIKVKNIDWDTTQ